MKLFYSFTIINYYYDYRITKSSVFKFNKRQKAKPVD